ncbi:hypothetical protein DOC35_19480 [Salmonella enterica subsp. enterica]|nr:hypothetical protein [Salmonella enterica subsp. enterica]
MNPIPIIDIPKRETLALVFADAEHKTPIAAYRLAWYCYDGKHWKPHGHFMGTLTAHTGGRKRKGALLPVKVKGAPAVYHLAEKATTALSRMIKDRNLADFPQTNMIILPMPYDRAPQHIAQLKTLADHVHTAPLFTDELPPRGAQLFGIGEYFPRFM